jgi:hypothetical protein
MLRSSMTDLSLAEWFAKFARLFALLCDSLSPPPTPTPAVAVVAGARRDRLAPASVRRGSAQVERLGEWCRRLCVADVRMCMLGAKTLAMLQARDASLDAFAQLARLRASGLRVGRPRQLSLLAATCRAPPAALVLASLMHEVVLLAPTRHFAQMDNWHDGLSAFGVLRCWLVCTC